MRRKLFMPTAAAFCACLALAGCGAHIQALNAPDVKISSEAPALNEHQVDKITTNFVETVNSAFTGSDESLLGARVQQPALTQLQSVMRMHALDPNTQALPTFPSKNISTTVSNNATWPRYLLNVAQDNGSKEVFVEIFKQDFPTQAYKLWQYTKLLNKAQFPGTNTLAQGFKLLNVKETGNLVVSPQQALQLWGKSIEDPTGEAAKQVAPDAIAETIRNQQTALSTAVGENGNLSFNIAQFSDPASMVAFELPSNEGALVAGFFTYAGSISDVNPSRPISLSGDVGLLLGDNGTIHQSASWTRQFAVLLLVPTKKDKDTKVHLISQSNSLVTATR